MPEKAFLFWLNMKNMNRELFDVKADRGYTKWYNDRKYMIRAVF